MARPRKVRTSARHETIVRALRAGAPRRTAAQHSGISYESFRVWVAEDSAFAEACSKAQADWQMSLVARMSLAAARGDSRAAQWLLERHPESRSEWGPSAVQRVVVEGSDTPVKVLHAVEAVSDPAAQFAKLAEYAKTLDVLVRVGSIDPPRLVGPPEDDE